MVIFKHLPLKALSTLQKHEWGGGTGFSKCFLIVQYKANGARYSSVCFDFFYPLHKTCFEKACLLKKN